MNALFKNIPKEHIQIATEFLKFCGWYGYWLKYIYDRRELSYKGYKNIEDIFGKTMFTDYLRNMFNIYLPKGFCVYEVFSKYVVLTHIEKASLSTKTIAFRVDFIKNNGDGNIHWTYPYKEYKNKLPLFKNC